WSTWSPQKTGSWAPGTTSFETGSDAFELFWSGPPSPTRYEPIQYAIQLSMIVEITSWAPTVAFRNPAMPAQNAPARVEATIAINTCGSGAMPIHDVPIQFAMNRPTKYWPWPPMLNMPQRNANATASPVRISVVVASSVCVRLYADVLIVFVVGWPNQLSPAPSKMS